MKYPRDILNLKQIYIVKIRQDMKGKGMDSNDMEGGECFTEMENHTKASGNQTRDGDTVS